MIPLVCLFGAAQGAVVERIGVRPALKIKSEFGWIMSTIALGIIFKNVAENVWGRDDLKFPSPLPEAPMKFLGANVLPMEILVIVGAVGMMLAVELFNRKSIYGKAVVATFNDRDAAKLTNFQGWRTSFHSPEINRLIEQAVRERDPEAQNAMYRQVQQLYDSEVGAIQPISQMLETVVLSKRVH
eukprot:gene17697-21647_t